MTYQAAQYDEEGFKVEATYRETCKKCAGTGRFMAFSSRYAPIARDRGDCFACKGQGFKEYRTSPQDRANARASDANRRQRNRTENVECFSASSPDEWAWIVAAAGRGFNFAASIKQAVEKYGELTEKQLAAVQRLAAQDAERNAQRQQAAQARVDAAPTLDTTKLEAAFDAAKASGLKRTKMRFSGFEVKPAKETSRNPGAYYVTSHGGDAYFGKIQNGKFVSGRDCSPEVQARVLDAMKDPLEAAKYFGRASGTCSCCGRELTDPASIEAGIGPICAGKFGL